MTSRVRRRNGRAVDAPPARREDRAMFDWGVGEYERTAAELEPAARHVVALAEIAAGETVLDVACGTGNAALLAAAAGARVTGLDAAPRLIEVARSRPGGDGVAFVVGDALDLPFAADAFDVVLSVFGIIFAPDAGRALGEVARVLKPRGRALLAVWMPQGPIHEMVGALGRAVAAAGGPERPRFDWHDPEAVAPVAAAAGMTTRAQDAGLVVEGESPEAYFAAAERFHPLSIAMRGLLDRTGRYPEIREEALGALRAGNEDPGGFRITSPYRVICLARAG
jgi:SAM-dependent methyltransferase